jgi:hypothetical protein
MPELLEPDVARRLLVTAARRQHVAAVHKIVTHERLEYIKQHTDAAALEVILFDLHRHAESTAYIFLLTKLPAAALLSSEAVIKLFLNAAAAHAINALFELCRLPAAQQFDRAAVLQLLQAAVQQGHLSSWFCELPAAQQLGSREVLQLLQAAVQGKPSPLSIPLLCTLPGAELMSCQAVLQLLQAAACSSCAARYQRLRTVQAAGCSTA